MKLNHPEDSRIIDHRIADIPNICNFDEQIDTERISQPSDLNLKIKQ
jgi:hypothetical protein